ncbi:MAG: hypothetical protein ACRD50_15205 [Candidatus Acidiferrales bacterium]
MIRGAVSLPNLLVGICGAALLLACVQASGQPQHGTAENGYYPPTYAGDTFTGIVTAVDDAARTITLTYTDPKHGKTDTFVGVLDAEYTARWKDGTKHVVKPSDIPSGTKLEVYYTSSERNVDGKKVKIHTIFLIKGVPNIAVHYSKFRAF